MALGNTQSNSNLRPTIWQKELYADVMDNLYFVQNGMMGKGENNIVELKDDLKEKKGNTIKYGLTIKLSGAGVNGDSELEGNEEKIVSYSDSIAIDKKRFAVRLDGKLDEQQAAYDLRSDAKDKLALRLEEFIERQVFLKLGGVGGSTLTDVNGTVVGADATWSNTPPVVTAANELAGTGARYLCAAYDPVSGTGGTPNLQAIHVLTPELISRLKYKALLASPKIVPIKIKGKNYFVMFVHPCQAYDLKQNENFKLAMREAQIRGDENPLFTGALGIWDGVVLHEHEYVPYLDVSAFSGSANFANSSGGTQSAVDVFRAILCGKQAVALAKASYENGWVEKSFDYGDKTGFATGLLGGIQKVTFNSKPYGTMLLDTAGTLIV